MNIVAVISAGVFGNQHRRSIKGGYVGDYVGEDLTSYYGGLFSWLVFTALMAYVPIGCIQYDRTFFLKERKAGLYSTAAWYCAYMSVETFIITNCSLSCGILYAQLMGFVRCWSVAVRPFGLQILCQLKFAVYFGAICNGLSLLFSQILMLSVAITRNLNAAFIIAMGVFIQGFITSGFPVDLTSMNPDATWLQYTCASAASPSLSVVPRKKTLVPPQVRLPLPVRRVPAHAPRGRLRRGPGLRLAQAQRHRLRPRRHVRRLAVPPHPDLLRLRLLAGPQRRELRPAHAREVRRLLLWLFFWLRGMSALARTRAWGGWRRYTRP
jgi:hypothetical protein